MIIAVAGATGYIGTAVVQALLSSGNKVIALGRNAACLARLSDSGAKTVQIDLRVSCHWIDSLRNCSAFIHLAATPEHSRVFDEQILTNILQFSEESDTLTRIIYTSGTMPFGNCTTEAVDENSAFGTTKETPKFIEWRPVHERRILNASRATLRTVVIRPGLVYGGEGGLFDLLRGLKDSKNRIRIPGSGRQHWSPVHVVDLAQLYVMAVLREGKGIYHGVENTPVQAGLIASFLDREDGGDGKSWRPWTVEKARTHFGSLADGLGLDQYVISRRCSNLGWKPEHSLINVVSSI